MVSLLTGDRCEWMENTQSCQSLLLSHREYFHHYIEVCLTYLLFWLLFWIPLYNCYSLFVAKTSTRFVNTFWLLRVHERFCTSQRSRTQKCMNKHNLCQERFRRDTLIVYIWKENVTNNQTEFSAIMTPNISYCGRPFEIVTLC